MAAGIGRVAPITVPLIKPVLELRVNPDGRAGLTDHV